MHLLQFKQSVGSAVEQYAFLVVSHVAVHPRRVCDCPVVFAYP